MGGGVSDSTTRPQVGPGATASPWGAGVQQVLHVRPTDTHRGCDCIEPNGIRKPLAYQMKE